MRYREELKILRNNPDVLQNTLGEELTITDGTLAQQMEKQASLYAKWGMLSALAEADYRRIKAEFDDDIAPRCRKAATSELSTRAKKPTIQAIQDEVSSYVAYKSATLELQDALTFSNMLKKAEVAFLQKKDMLQSLNRIHATTEV